MGSLMQLANYEQTRFCALCAPDFLRSVADMIAGVDLGDDTAAPQQPASEECPLCGQTVDLDDVNDHIAMHIDAGDIPGAGAEAVRLQPTPEMAQYLTEYPAGPDGPADRPSFDDWLASRGKPDPMTTNVRKSTHGHRTPRGKSGAPAGGDD